MLSKQVCQSVCPSVYPTVCLSVSVSNLLFACPSVCPFFCLFVCQCVHCSSISVSIYLSGRLSVCLFLCCHDISIYRDIKICNTIRHRKHSLSIWQFGHFKIKSKLILDFWMLVQIVQTVRWMSLKVKVNSSNPVCFFFWRLTVRTQHEIFFSWIFLIIAFKDDTLLSLRCAHCISRQVIYRDMWNCISWFVKLYIVICEIV